MEEAQAAASAKRSPRAALLRCADLAEELEVKAARLARAQEAVIVPSTAAFINATQQWKFNDKARVAACGTCALPDPRLTRSQTYDTTPFF